MGKVKPSKAQKEQVSAERVESAIGGLLDMFESGRMPEAIAETVIRRSQSDAPSAQWSLGNQLIMLMSGTADARGFRQWQEVNRSVSKGSKALYILSPMARKFEDEATGETRTVLFGFRGTPVFRYEDTEGEELAVEEYEPVELPPLFETAERLGLSGVKWAPFAKSVRGYYSLTQDRIQLHSHDARIWFHELAHAAHARVEKLVGGQNARQEIIAETTAAVLCVMYGFEGYVPHSHEYIRRYAGEVENPARAVMGVLSMVQKVLAVIFDGEASEAEEV